MLRSTFASLVAASALFAATACGSAEDTRPDEGDTTAEWIVEQTYQSLTGEQAGDDETKLYSDALRAGVTLHDVAADIVAEQESRGRTTVRDLPSMGRNRDIHPAMPEARMKVEIKIPEAVTRAYYEWANLYVWVNGVHWCP
jgi:hypothetical protein